MLDPLAALGAVANIAQFIEFAIKISSKSRDIYHSASGNPIELEDLRDVNDDLSKISRKLRNSFTSATTSTCLTEDEQALHELCKGCIDVSEELTAALSKIEHHGKRGKFRSFRQALKSVWSKEDIDQLEKRMKLYKEELNFRIIVGLRYKIDFQAIQQTDGFALLAEEAKTTIQSLICVKTEVRDGFERQEAVIADLHLRTEDVISVQGEHRRDEHLELTSRVTSLAQQTSDQSQHQLDAGAITKLAVDLSLERNLAEHERTRNEMKRLKEQAEKQVEVLTEEIRQLKIELEAGVKTIVASIGAASTREAESLKEISNAKFNLWVAKELILEKLKAFVALFRFNFTTEAWMPKATTITTWKLVPYPKFMGTAAEVTNATVVTEHTVAYRHVEICYPIAARNVPMVKMCLDQGVDVNKRLPDGDYVLVKAILATYPSYSHTSISEALAMRRDGRKIIQLLIEHGADPTKLSPMMTEEVIRDWMVLQILKHVTNFNLRTFLMLTDAVWMGDVEQVKNTLSEMPKLCGLLAHHKSSPLGIAVYQDDEEMVRLLLKSGISADALDPIGSTPLAIAVSCHREHMVRILRTYGASITIQDPFFRRTPLEYALTLRSHNLCVALLDTPWTLNTPSECMSYQKALTLSIECYRAETVALLLDKGADVMGHSLTVTGASNDDNSIIALSHNTLKTLQIFRGDTVLVKSKNDKITVLIVLGDGDLDDGSVGINRVVRHNLLVKNGDLITIHPYPDMKYASRIEVLPIADTVEGITGSLFDVFLAPYFRETYRPIRQGDIFTARGGVRQVEFKVVKVDPLEFGIVSQDTVIDYGGEPNQREFGIVSHDTGIDCGESIRRTDDDGINQQMALLLMQSNWRPRPSANNMAFSIDLPEDT